VLYSLVEKRAFTDRVEYAALNWFLHGCTVQELTISKLE
jgi:hypothetical protein